MTKIATKIFRVDPDVLGSTSEKRESIIKNFIKNYNETHDLVYSKIDINNQFIRNGFSFLLYVQRAEPKEPEWVEFLNIIVSNNSIKDVRSLYPSYILFVIHEKEVFVLTGGAGSKVVDPLLDSMFGFNILERLVDEKNSDVRSISQRAFIGIELASERYFKADYRLTDEDNFGKYYKELQAFIDHDKLAKIGISTVKGKLLVKGEYGFKIDTKISFAETIDRIKKLIELLDIEPSIELNPFRKLSNRDLNRPISSGSTLESILNEELYEYYFENFKLETEIEIYHPNLLDFLKTQEVMFQKGKSKINISSAEPINLRKIFNRFHITDEIKDFESFKKNIRSIETKIENDVSGQYYSNADLDKWFFGEVIYQGVKYIKFENAWFTYTSQYEKDLNHRLDILKEKIKVYKSHDWTSDFGNEGDYNNDFYVDGKNEIVGDKCFIKNIEIADALVWNDKVLNVIHVKEHLDRNFRVLQSQIINSWKQLRRFTGNESDYDLELYYKDLKSNAIKLKREIIDLEYFKNLIKVKNENINYVFAFTSKSDSTTIEEIIDEIKSSKSTIAKLALLDCFYTLNSFDIALKICKIRKS